MSLCVFQFFFLWLISSFLLLLSKKIKIISSIFSIYWDLFCVLTCGLSWKMFRVHWKRMYILKLWGEMLWRYQWNSSDLVCNLRPLFPYSFSVWNVYPFSVNGVWIYYCQYLLLCAPNLLYIFRCSYIGCINVCKGYIFLLDCSPYHYVVTFFVFYDSLCFKVYFAKVLLPLLFFLSIFNLFPSLYF